LETHSIEYFNMHVYALKRDLLEDTSTRICETFFWK
jgi:hypothetical protein